jgi:hypothetical protein
MKQEIVLPKFKIPGQTNWLVRGLWIGGGLVVVMAGLVVFALARRNEKVAEQAQRVQAAQAAAAAAAIEAAKVAPEAKPARVAASKTLASKAPMSGAALVNTKPGVVAKPRAGLTSKGKMKARNRAGYTLRKKSTRSSKLYSTKAAARGGAKPAPKAKPGAKGGDAIDDILRGFK